MYITNGLIAVLRLASYLCAEHTKIVRQAAWEQADSTSHRMSIKLYRIEARYFVPEVKHAPLVIYATHKDTLKQKYSVFRR